MVFCECGEEITSEDVKFCPECGKKMNLDLLCADKAIFLKNEKFTDPALKERKTADELLVQGKPIYDAMNPAIQGHKNKIQKIEENFNKLLTIDKDRIMMRMGFNALIEQNKILIKQNEFIYLQNNEIIKALERLNKKLEENQYK